MNDLHGPLSTEIVTFAPKAQTYKVRAGYYDGINKYLAEFHPDRATGLPDFPQGTDMLEGFPTDDHVVDTFWLKNSEEHLDSYRAKLDKELYDRGVVRGRETIPFVLRPMILNRHTYREVLGAAESAVSLMVKTQNSPWRNRNYSRCIGTQRTTSA